MEACETKNPPRTPPMTKNSDGSDENTQSVAPEEVFNSDHQIEPSAKSDYENQCQASAFENSNQNIHESQPNKKRKIAMSPEPQSPLENHNSESNDLSENIKENHNNSQQSEDLEEEGKTVNDPSPVDHEIQNEDQSYDQHNDHENHSSPQNYIHSQSPPNENYESSKSFNYSNPSPDEEGKLSNNHSPNPVNFTQIPSHSREDVNPHVEEAESILSSSRQQEEGFRSSNQLSEGNIPSSNPSGSTIKENTVYDFEISENKLPLNKNHTPDMSKLPVFPQNLGINEASSLQDHKTVESLESFNPSIDYSKRNSIIPSINQIVSHATNSSHSGIIPNALSNPIGNIPNELLNQSYESSVSGTSSTEFPSTAACFDPVVVRRGRGRPRGSKNGTGIGRSRGSYNQRNNYRFNVPDGRESPGYDLRHITDPYGTARRGRPRSRFIVDLGEQNHEAWTKARVELSVSDGELTTLLLSLLESRQDLEDSKESDTMLGLLDSEYKKWKDKFATQISMLSHFVSIHNSNCSTCLGIKKKKLIVSPSGNGLRGRPRKYPPPVGYGPGMQRPDTIDEDGNIFEPQCILKDGTIVKAEPTDDKSKIIQIHNGESRPEGSTSSASSSNGGMVSPMSQLPPRAMITHEEMQKRREYYSNHKNKIKYVCHFCQVHFYHKPNFDFHIKKLEREGKCRVYDKVNNLYLCESCGEGFSWREKLEKHMRLAEQHGTHNQKELLIYGDFQCSMCGKTFNKRNTYLQHVKWHEDREDVPCVICATMFKQTDLRQHLMEAHNNDSLPCCYCGKLFTSRKYLEKHELVHQSGNFPCPECGKCFSQKVTMQHHLRSHSLDKEYSCDACSQVYTQRMGICHHLRKQFGISDFNEECEMCTMYFCSTYDLQLHKRKIHNISTESMGDELPPESYLPLNMRANHHMQVDPDEERNAVVKNMIEAASMSSSLSNSLNNLPLKHEGSDHMEDHQHDSISEESVVDDITMRNNYMRANAMRGEMMREEVDMREDDEEEVVMRQNTSRGSLMRESGIFRDNSLRELTMRENQQREELMRENNALLMNEHMRHMMDRRELNATEDMRSMNPNLHSVMQQNQQQGSLPQQMEEHHQMPQDLTRMNNSHNMTQHIPPDDSPGRDNTPINHINDQLSRMASDNFSRMSGTPQGYLAEHIRRMAENHSRNSVGSVDNSMGGHYDERDYNARSMSRGSPAETMPRIGENLSHMGVIRPSQGVSSTPQWPPHMQNPHSSGEGMNQSAQGGSGQHALYPLPFWPYDPSLRHYNH